jgi:DNA-binding transcriptional MerR regulator
MSERLWTVREVADRYRVQPPAVLRWVRTGKLVPAARRPGARGAWLFREADVLALGSSRAHVGPTVSDVAAIIDAEINRVRGRGA